MEGKVSKNKAGVEMVMFKWHSGYLWCDVLGSIWQCLSDILGTYDVMFRVASCFLKSPWIFLSYVLFSMLFCMSPKTTSDFSLSRILIRGFGYMPSDLIFMGKTFTDLSKSFLNPVCRSWYLLISPLSLSLTSTLVSHSTYTSVSTAVSGFVSQIWSMCLYHPLGPDTVGAE